VVDYRFMQRIGARLVPAARVLAAERVVYAEGEAAIPPVVG